MKQPLPGFRLACLSTAFAAVVVLLGAFTRLADAGLGCPDWPGCYGFIGVPQTAEQLAHAELHFPHAPVEAEKGWAEMVHRYFAGTLGLLVLGLAIIAWRNRHLPGYPRWLAAGLLGLVTLQAAFGMWTVTLKLWPQVVVAHLLGGFATLSLLALHALRLGGFRLHLAGSDWARRRVLAFAACIGLLILVAQIALGGWTSANYAALACTDLPTCQSQWWPSMDFRSGFNLAQEVGPNYLGGVLDNQSRVAIHVTHRIGAIVTTVYLLFLVALIIKATYNYGLKLIAGTLLVVLVCQVALGISNIVWLLPLPVALAHNGGAAALLLVMACLNAGLLTAKPREA